MRSEMLPLTPSVREDHPEQRRRYRAPILHDARLWLGVALLVIILAVVFLGGRLAPNDPHALSGQPMERPSRAHLLGTNDIGQDVFSQVVRGGRVSIAVGFGAAILSTAIAWTLGLLSGFGRRWSALVAGIADLFLALPFLPVTILVVAHLGPSPTFITITVGLISWPAFTRVLRARVATELSAGYIEAARAIGAHPATIMTRHVLPATVPVVIAKFVLTVQSAIVIQASLAFLGLSDPVTISWGGIIHRGVGYGLIFASGAWRWWLVPPTIAIAWLICAIALIGWAIEERTEYGSRFP
jgi:ABC-type dipeptide/oligopeptide/nickel transport system permease subunit